MSWGSSQTTSSNQSTNQLGNSASIPVQQDWVANLQKMLGGSSQSLVQQAGMPVFGTAQKASFLNDLNEGTDASGQRIASQLASRGALDSGAFGANLTNLQMGRQVQISNYNTQVPILDQQARQANLAKALTTSGAISSLAPTGQLSSSSSEGTSSGSSTQTTNPGFGSLLGGLLGFGLSALTGSGGLSGLIGQSPGLGSSQAPAPINPYTILGSGLGYGPPSPPTPWAASQ